MSAAALKYNELRVTLSVVDIDDLEDAIEAMNCFQHLLETSEETQISSVARILKPHAVRLTEIAERISSKYEAARVSEEKGKKGGAR
jgi:hypothetical protein